MAKRASKAPAASATDKASAPPAAGGQAGGRGAGRSRGRSMQSVPVGAGKDRHLVIVESPSKAKTINKYLGPEYLVLASIGHVRDLPSKNPKGVKSPVPGVDLEKKFKPTYEILPGKEKVISDLKRAAKECRSTGMNVWFATDLDREGEAIAWHLADELGIAPADAKRVIFPAITKGEIQRAFNNPHPIDVDRVNAQQARRILDRIVGYQVSPLLWKKVARGLSAGRVQSVAVRVVVEREREIRAFVPEEYWTIEGGFVLDRAVAAKLIPAWKSLLAQRDEKKQPPTQKARAAWRGEQGVISAELVEIGGEKFDLRGTGADLTARAREIAQLVGLTSVEVSQKSDPDGRGPAATIRTVSGLVDPTTPYKVASIETKRTTTRPSAPFITSTLQQAASSRLGFGAQRTMRAAQQLYEGVDIPGEGPTGLITYMRTDSTSLSRDALEMARGYIGSQFGAKYLPEKPNFFSSSNKDAQEAHEAIRPTNVELTPAKVRRALTEDQFRLYSIIWERFVACQMVPAEWDATAVTITGGTDPRRPVSFRATGRVLVFDGHYKVSGVPRSGEEQNLPELSEGKALAPVILEPEQRFTSPPARYSEASLIKVLESEGIGRPSTYASIIQTIQDRKYVEARDRRMFATDLGEVVTDKLIEAFPEIMDVGYTREMEGQLDKVEEDHIDWVEMLEKFYGPFRKSLKRAEETLKHAKAEVTPAPKEYTCPTCAKEGRGVTGLVYRFGKNGRFLSCSRYPECTYATPVDAMGRPKPVGDLVDIACPKCGGAMTRREGRFGPFLGCARYGNKESPCDGILNIDRKGYVTAPSQPPLVTELPCPTCGAPLNLRGGVRGPWLGCSKFPKCRGRGKWAELPEGQQKTLELAFKNHDKQHPVKVIRTMSGKALTGDNGKPLAGAASVAQLAGGGAGGDGPAEETSLEAVADAMGM